MNVQREKMPSGASLFDSDPEIMGGLDEIIDTYPGLPRDSAIAAIELAGAAIEQGAQSRSG